MNMGDHMMEVGIHWPFVMMGIIGLALAVLFVVLVRNLRRPAQASGFIGNTALGARLSLDLAQAPQGPDDEDRITDMAIVIPDISGYTDYMSHSRFSLRHAQYVVGELLSAIAAAARPGLSVCRPEGDALLLYKALGQEDDEAIAERLVAILTAFYQRRQELADENACRCQACARIDSLELKMIVHRGPVMETHIAGFHALAGIPVIEAHRLLKNAVSSRRYVLVTGAAEPLVAGLPAWPSEHLKETTDDGSVLNLTVYGFEPAQLPDVASPEQLPRSVKKVCDLCRKVGHNLKDIAAS